MRGRPAGIAPKVTTVAQALAARIRAGDYLGCDLPSETALAAQHGVSYLTARRAAAQVIAEGLITRKSGGRLVLAERGEARPLMLGWVVPTWSSFDVLRWQRAMGEAATTRAAVLRPLLASGWQDPALLAMARRADGLIVYPGDWGQVPDELATATRMVTVDRASGRDDVLALDAFPVAMVDDLCANLSAWGRRRIAWVGDAQETHTVVTARRARWAACANGPELPRDRTAIAAAIRTGACDAVLAPRLGEALLALRAARDVGAQVPTDIAVAVVNDEGLGETLVPALCAPRAPDLTQWLTQAIAWIAGDPWQQPTHSAPFSIERRETA